VLDIKNYDENSTYAIHDERSQLVAEEDVVYETIPQLEKGIARTKKQMEKAASDLDFLEAARLRDKMFTLQQQLKEMKGK